MGNAWSWVQHTDQCLNVSCTKAVDIGITSATISGIGTFILFFVTVCLTMILSVTNICRQWRDSNRLKAGTHITDTRLSHFIAEDSQKSNVVTETVILSLSDQQLIAGLAMATTLRWYYSCSMSAYHYDLACYMLLCSVITHLCSLLAIDKYFYPFASHSVRSVIYETILLVLRILGITLTIILTGLILFNRNSSTFPVVPPNKLLLFPAKCFFTGADIKDALKGIDNSITGYFAHNWLHGLVQYVLLIAGVIVIIPLAIINSFERGIKAHRIARHEANNSATSQRRISSLLRHPKIILWPRLIVTLVVIAVSIWTFVLAWKLRVWGVQQDGNATQDEWTFAQILAVFLLAISPITALDAAADKYDSRKQKQENDDAEEVVALNPIDALRPVSLGYDMVGQRIG